MGLLNKKGGNLTYDIKYIDAHISYISNQNFLEAKKPLKKGSKTAQSVFWQTVKAPCLFHRADYRCKLSRTRKVKAAAMNVVT